MAQGNNHGATTLITSTLPSSGYTTAAGFAASGSGNASAAVVTNAPVNGTTYLGFNTSLGAAAIIPYTINDISFGSLSTGTGPHQLALYGSTDGFNTISTLLGTVNTPTNSLLRRRMIFRASRYNFRITGALIHSEFMPRS